MILKEANMSVAFDMCKFMTDHHLLDLTIASCYKPCKNSKMSLGLRNEADVLCKFTAMISENLMGIASSNETNYQK